MPSFSDSKQRLEIFDSIGTDEDSNNRMRSGGGCYVSALVGFALVLVAVLISVGVGVIVFFASPGREVKCVCDYPVAPTASPEEQWRHCSDLSVSRNECLSTPPCTGIYPTNQPPPVTSTVAPETPNVRLPLDILPDAYDLELFIDIYGDDPDKFSFNGAVTILVNCTQNTKVMVLHYKKLTIDNNIEIRAVSAQMTPPQYDRYELDNSTDFLKIHVKGGEFEKDHQYQVTIKFTGELKDDLGGIYRSSYLAGNKTRYIATTQMQPTDARKAFPCFDEPALKATFNVTLWRKSPMISLSNTHQLYNITGTNDWVGDRYAVTPKMSTYLLAFIICDFKYKEDTTSTGTKVRVWARPDAIDTVDYALWTGVNITEYFETYFGIPFPLEKQDMIAIPDFAAGAMENWGLITYRETALLYDPKVSSESNKQRVVTVVSHELAHQWFGNLVSPSWWDDLWLNEGFASYVEYIGVDNVHKDWAMMDQFVSMDLHDVFKVDGLANSHPIYVPVNHPDEINEIFDKISYSKGASIIRMMNGFLGEKTFRTGLTNYLKKHSYSDANHTDLWTALGEQAAKDDLPLDVPNIMNSWLLQMGYPVVKMEKGFGKVKVTQKHFLMDYSQTPSSKYPSPYNYKWDIPLTYITGDSKQKVTEWFYRDKESVEMNAPAGWILGNYEQVGYYRVNYDESNWDALIGELQSNHRTFHVRNRAQLIDDAFNLGRNGVDLDQRYGLKATLYLVNETEYVPWSTASINLGYFKTMFKFHGTYGSLKKYILNLALPHYNKYGWDIKEDDLHLDRYKKALWISLACSNGDSSCTDEAVKRFKEWQTDGGTTNNITTDLKSLTYCIAVANGGIEEWEFARKQFKATTNANEKINLLYAMSCTAQPWIMSKYLNNAVNPDEIRKQDAVSALVYASRNPIGLSLTWDFVRSKWDYLMNVYGAGFFSFSSLISGMTETFNTDFRLQQLEEFVANNPNLGTGQRAFEQAIEKTKLNIRWMKENEVKITEWLADQ